MTQKRMIRNWQTALCLLAGWLLAACASEEEWAAPDAPASEPGFHIALSVAGQATTGRAATEPGVDALNENTVNMVDVFIFKADGSLNPGGHVQATAAAGQPVTVYKGRQWRNHFTPGETYSVYVVANAAPALLANVNTLGGLQAAAATDARIAEWQGMPGFDGTKSFLMDGKAEFGYDQLPDAKLHNVPVVLSRAAAKIEITVQLQSEFAGKFTPNNLKAQLANYATATSVLADGNALAAGERGFATYPAEPSAAGREKERFSGNPVVRAQGGAVVGSTVRFYAYANQWENLASNETQLLIDLPGELVTQEADEATGQEEVREQLAHNFYKIPIVNNSLPPVLNRNTHYKVKAFVNMRGSADIDTPVEVANVQFQVAPWTENTVHVGEGDAPSYLVLNTNHVDIRHADGYDGLEFYSSSPIDSVKAVGFDNQAAATAAGVEFEYPGSGQKIPAIFFVDKDNQRRVVGADNTGISFTYDPDQSVGKIHIASPDPTNVTKRYITLKVTNTEGVAQYVVVEQYPLEYIQPIAGYYSYRDDLKAAGGTYEQRGNRNATVSWGSVESSPSNNSYFISKVFTNNKILGWYWRRGYDDPQTADYSSFAWGSGSFDDNNMMYFVTITQPNENYQIAHPLTELDKNNDNQMVAVSSAENDELVSPAFMLASQLGTVTSNNIRGWTEARKHCANYVETYKGKDGKTVVLDDWRLPTSKEIGVIIDYQNNRNAQDVMDEVLGGRYYYVSYRGARNNTGSADTEAGDNGTFVRCIRDVKPTDEFMQRK